MPRTPDDKVTMRIQSPYVFPGPRIRQPGRRKSWRVSEADPGLKDITLPVLTPGLSKSSLETFHTCPRKFLLRHRFGWTPKGFMEAAGRGGVCHRVHELHLLGRDIPGIVESIEADKTALLKGLQAEADEGGFLPGGRNLETAEQEIVKAHDVGLAMGIATLGEVDTDKYTALPTHAERFVEVDLEAPRLPSPIRMILDQIMVDRETDEKWIVDIKTTGLPSGSIAATKSFALESALYRLAGHALFPDDPPVGIMHLIIETPGIKFCSKDADILAYADRVKAWYADPPASVPNPILCSWVRYSGPILTQETMVSLVEADHASRCDPDLWMFPRWDHNCIGKFGRKPCEYLELCQREPDQWVHELPGRFTRRGPDGETHEIEPVVLENVRVES